MLDRTLIELIQKTIGTKRNYTWSDVYRVAEAMLEVLTDESEEQ